MNHLSHLTALLAFCCLNQAASEVYHISADHDLCTVQSCLTLTQFAGNLNHYLSDSGNTTLIFLPGEHYLNAINLTLSDVDYFVMQSEAENSTAQIKCTNDSRIHFSQLQFIRITNLEFIGCGGNQVKRVKELMVQRVKFKGEENSGTALELTDSTAQIINSMFVSYKQGSYRKCVVILNPKDGCDSSAGFVGGAIIATNSSISISQSKFEDNGAEFGGTILAEQQSIINVSSSEFISNNATNGGILASAHSSTTAIESNLNHTNGASPSGGVIFSYISTIIIEASKFCGNKATTGGVLHFHSSIGSIKTSEFYDNYAAYGGGVLDSFNSSITISGCNFTRNGSPIGAVTYVADSSIRHHNSHYSTIIDNNSAGRYAAVYLSDSRYDSEGNITFSNNLGSLVAFNSNITITGNANFVANHPRHSTTGDLHEGGAITLFQSNLVLDGVCTLEYNVAENGGAIHSTESKIYLNGHVVIAHNTATRNGGGVYLSTSELNCQRNSNFTLFNNSAVYRGGALHSISSSIKATSAIVLRPVIKYTGARMSFTNNAAKWGGGLSMEANAKLYILKNSKISTETALDSVTIFFVSNTANYGGALYVDDNTNSGTCTNDPKTECFFQVLAVHNREDESLTTQSMYFSQNVGSISGSTLYGGLLDRCAVSQFAEVHNKHNMLAYEYKGDGVSYFRDTSTGENNLLSSRPVRLCLCNGNHKDTNNCTHQSNIEVKKGQEFTQLVVAVDQVGQPVSAIIQTSLHFSESGLAEGQLARRIPAECTSLTFNIVSLHSSENLTLYASNGPCKDADLSTVSMEIQFLPCSCPIGLQVTGKNRTNCTMSCECHHDIIQYMKQCDSHTGLLIKQPQSRAWISYINNTDLDLIGYLVYPNCPFDYCSSTSLPIDLNQPDGADAQCAFNRSSLLCGSCRLGLSLSLGSSRCLPCPSYWPVLFLAITIAAILAGMALVALLLVLNMTVATGTLNGLIFYANIVYANKNILLPFQEANFISLFISWLNLELGVDVCYFPGMDTYIKTWLQLAFPAYIIFLVVLVNIISSRSSKFSNLIGKKNPVATLATLLLLSYEKLLEICFKSLSVAYLEYPDKLSGEKLWIPDATVKYLSGKHVPLFIAAVLVLLVGLVYTALLFSWQWLLCLPRWRVFKWTRNSKLQTFIETYHKPYTPKHRYWTGLLLIVRIVLYLVAAVNVANDPAIALTAISFTTCCVLTLSKFIGSRMYRKRPIDVLETFIYLNILSFAIFTWYSLYNPGSNREAAAYTSVIFTIIILLLIILYHVYAYTTLFSKIKTTTWLGGTIDRLFIDVDPEPKSEHYLSPPPDNDIHRFGELLDMIDHPATTDDYRVPLTLAAAHKQLAPTQSEVEMVSCHASPDPEDLINTHRAPKS